MHLQNVASDIVLVVAIPTLGEEGKGTEEDTHMSISRSRLEEAPVNSTHLPLGRTQLCAHTSRKRT